MCQKYVFVLSNQICPSQTSSMRRHILAFLMSHCQDFCFSFKTEIDLLKLDYTQKNDEKWHKCVLQNRSIILVVGQVHGCAESFSSWKKKLNSSKNWTMNTKYYEKKSVYLKQFCRHKNNQRIFWLMTFEKKKICKDLWIDGSGFVFHVYLCCMEQRTGIITKNEKKQRTKEMHRSHHLLNGCNKTEGHIASHFLLLSIVSYPFECFVHALRSQVM